MYYPIPIFSAAAATTLVAIILTCSSNTVKADQVINDDLIVTFSECIGNDCVNGESFGSDTIRLKENNLRIKFDDTSNAASFPRNDWQLTANESENGGANKFSIDDITGGRTPFTIEASAPNHSLYVDDGGRIGIGTSTPVVEMHVVDGDSPTLRLEQDGSSGFAAQIWDVAGNETNFFVRDVTNNSALPFRIRPNAPDSSIYIDTDGDVGMGTSSPAAALHIADSMNAQLRIQNTSTSVSGDALMLNLTNPTTSTVRFLINAGGSAWTFDNNPTVNPSAGTNSGQFRISKLGTGVAEFTVDGFGDGRFVRNSFAVDHVNTSSRDLKTDFASVDEQGVLEKLATLPISTWRYRIETTEKKHIGPMAEDFQATFGLSDGQHISTVDASGVALAAIKGLHQTVEGVQERNRSLAQEIQTLKQELADKNRQLQGLVDRLAALETLTMDPQSVAATDVRQMLVTQPYSVQHKGIVHNERDLGGIAQAAPSDPPLAPLQ